MRRSIEFAVQGACLALALIWFTGCSQVHAARVDKRAVDVEASAPGKVYIAWSEGYEEDDGFLVTGVVRRRDTVGLPIKAIVHARVVSASGTILEEAQSDTLYVPRRRVDRVQGFQRFRLRLPHVPPEDASVCLVASSI